MAKTKSHPKHQPIDPAKVADWLNRKWKGEKKCPICGENHWHISEWAYTPKPVFKREGYVMLTGGAEYPSAVVVCQTCGYTMMFNAIIMGLVPKTPDPEEETGGVSVQEGKETSNGVDK